MSKLSSTLYWQLVYSGLFLAFHYWLEVPKHGVQKREGGSSSLQKRRHFVWFFSFKEVIFGSKAFFLHLGTSKGPEGCVGSEREVRKHTAAEAARVVSGMWGRTGQGWGIFSGSPENSSSSWAGHTAAWLCPLLPRGRLCDLTKSCQPPGRPCSSCRQGSQNSEGPGSFLCPHSWGVVGLGPEPSSPVAWALPWPRVRNPRLSVSCRFTAVGE